MRTKAILLTPFVILPALLQAQDKITVNFAAESPRLVFSSPAWPTAIAGTEEVKTDKKIDFEAGAVKLTDYIVVFDRDTNNVAVRQAKDLKGEWTLQPQDYRYLGNLTVRVEHEGKPISAASVLAESKGKQQTQLIDPNSKGEAKFFALDPGDIKVQVTYKVGQKSLSTKQGFEVQLTRQRVDPILVVSIPDDVQTTTGSPTTSASTALPTTPGKSGEAKGSDGTKDADQGPKEAPRGGLGTGVAVLLGLGLAIGGGYFLLQWINQNPGRLKQLGIPVPDTAAIPDGAQPGDPPAAYHAPAPEPVQQIILGGADPTPIGAVASVPMPSSVAAGGPPKLVGDGGRTVELHSGETVVGRDDEIALSLAGESTVSRRHATIQFDGNVAKVKDLGSTNGTFVNGNRLQGEVVLQIGDVVQFGSVRFRYEA